jgi:hypothetical protein
VDLEEELAESVHDLLAPVDQLQLAGELGRPFRQLLDVGEVGEDLISRGFERAVTVWWFMSRSTPSRRV